MKKTTIFLVALLLSLAGLTAHADEWVGTWATAPEFTGQGDMPQHTTLTDNSIRQIVHVSIGGDVLRLQLSNEFSREAVEIRSVYIADAKDSTALSQVSAMSLLKAVRRCSAMRCAMP